MQYVKVDLNGRAYTYAWAGDSLKPNDWVVVPGNSYNPDPSAGRVIRVLPMCDFTGKVTVLRQRVDMNAPQQIDTNQPTPDSSPEPHDWDDYGYTNPDVGVGTENF